MTGFLAHLRGRWAPDGRKSVALLPAVPSDVHIDARTPLNARRILPHPTDTPPGHPWIPGSSLIPQTPPPSPPTRWEAPRGSGRTPRRQALRRTATARPAAWGSTVRSRPGGRGTNEGEGGGWGPRGDGPEGTHPGGVQMQSWRRFSLSGSRSDTVWSDPEGCKTFRPAAVVKALGVRWSRLTDDTCITCRSHLKVWFEVFRERGENRINIMINDASQKPTKRWAPALRLQILRGGKHRHKPSSIQTVTRWFQTFSTKPRWGGVEAPLTLDDPPLGLLSRIRATPEATRKRN